MKQLRIVIADYDLGWHRERTANHNLVELSC